MFTYILHILEFMELFHFPKITQKRSRFPGILEISFKVETLTQPGWELDGRLRYMW